MLLVPLLDAEPAGVRLFAALLLPAGDTLLQVSAHMKRPKPTMCYFMTFLPVAHHRSTPEDGRRFGLFLVPHFHLILAVGGNTEGDTSLAL